METDALMKAKTKSNKVIALVSNDCSRKVRPKTASWFRRAVAKERYTYGNIGIFNKSAHHSEEVEKAIININEPYNNTKQYIEENNFCNLFLSYL